MSRSIAVLVCFLLAACSHAEPPRAPAPAAAQQRWVDSIYNRLGDDERIGQLIMVAAYSGGPKSTENIPEIEWLLRAHQIGGLIFMQGGPARQADLTNRYQQMAQVPLLIAMDAEWGLGMRLDSVWNFPRQMLLGAADDSGMAHLLGMAVAYQCKRLGVHIDFAPVVDVNNNPGNPVINSRSFGENKVRVARLGIAYMKGLQEGGVMACAKHFPGHGDVSVDSHKDLPVIAKSRAALDTLELYPFRELIKAGVQSVMVAHLAVPALERELHVPTTLSKKTVTGLLKTSLGFNGLVFTDALNMQGVAKYFAPGEADLRAFLAGNDVLLFSQDVPAAIAKIRAAVVSGKISRADLEARVKKILTAKWNAGLSKVTPIAREGAVRDLNLYTADFNKGAAEKAITMVRDHNRLVPVKNSGRHVLQIFLGAKNGAYAAQPDGFSDFYVDLAADKAAAGPAERMINQEQWDAVVVTVCGLSQNPANHYGLNAAAQSFLDKVKSKPNVIVAVMGNAYALQYVCDAATLVCGYEENAWTIAALRRLVAGEINAAGHLPVTPPCLK